MNKIKHYRMAAGLTQEELAQAAGQGGQSTISNYESGYRTPDLSACRAITAALVSHGADVSLDDVFPPDQSNEAA